MIEYSYDVIDLFIIAIFDVQYVVVTYVSRSSSLESFWIHWIFLFTDQKWIAHY